MQIAIVPDDPRRRVVATYGKYTVFYDPMPHRPWGLFRVYHRERYVASQLSFPCRSDCEWHERRHGEYASPDENAPLATYRSRQMKHLAKARAFSVSSRRKPEPEEVT